VKGKITSPIGANTSIIIDLILSCCSNEGERYREGKGKKRKEKKRKAMATTGGKEERFDPSNFRTMRDINDFCEKRKIPSLAQGMIELPPPLSLRKLASEAVLTDNIHTVRYIIDLIE